MFLTREIDLKLYQHDTKSYIYEIWYINQSFKQITFSNTEMHTTYIYIYMFG